MKRRMMISLNDEPATPGPPTPGPPTPKPSTPGINGGKGGGGGGGKGGGGKMAPSMNNSQQQHPFSPQPNVTQYGNMGQQQQQQTGNPPPGSVPPPGAVQAAQEVVDIATRQITVNKLVSLRVVVKFEPFDFRTLVVNLVGDSH